jgi:hypothetical protein
VSALFLLEFRAQEDECDRVLVAGFVAWRRVAFFWRYEPTAELPKNDEDSAMLEKSVGLAKRRVASHLNLSLGGSMVKTS